MSRGFYRGAVGDWFGDAIAAMFTEPESSPVKEPELLAGRANVIEDPRHADFAMEAHRILTEFPCEACPCTGCYGCGPSGEPCGCDSEENAVVPWPDEEDED